MSRDSNIRFGVRSGFARSRPETGAVVGKGRLVQRGRILVLPVESAMIRHVEADAALNEDRERDSGD